MRSDQIDQDDILLLEVHVGWWMCRNKLDTLFDAASPEMRPRRRRNREGLNVPRPTAQLGDTSIHLLPSTAALIAHLPQTVESISDFFPCHSRRRDAAAADGLVCMDNNRAGLHQSTPIIARSASIQSHRWVGMNKQVLPQSPG